MEDNTEERGFGETVEREDAEDTEDTADDQRETTSNQDQETETEETANQDDSADNKDEEKDDKSQDSKSDQEKTDKGTNLDKNPKSAVHQQLANATRVARQMEAVLGDPAKIARWMKEQYGLDVVEKSEAKATETTTTKKWTAKDFENIEDVADKFNQLQETFTQTMSEKDKKIEALEKQVGGIQNSGRMREIADNTGSEVKSLQAEPELNPKSPLFIEGLESQIASLYQKLDFDEESGAYRGRYSIKEIGDQFLTAARAARKAGRLDGQTIIKDKTAGRVRTGTKVEDTTPDKELTAGASIAQGIAKMFPRGV